MEQFWFSFFRFCNVFVSYTIAFFRLLNWTVLFFFSGLQRTLFMRSEIVCVEFRTIPMRCDREDADEKLAYLDKLCLENPDLMKYVEDMDDIEDVEDTDEGDEE